MPAELYSGQKSDQMEFSLIITNFIFCLIILHNNEILKVENKNIIKNYMQKSTLLNSNSNSIRTTVCCYCLLNLFYLKLPLINHFAFL